MWIIVERGNCLPNVTYIVITLQLHCNYITTLIIKKSCGFALCFSWDLSGLHQESLPSSGLRRPSLCSKYILYKHSNILVCYSKHSIQVLHALFCNFCVSTALLETAQHTCVYCQILVISTEMCMLCIFLCFTSCFIVQPRASISSFVNKPPTLMSIDAVILPLMVLIGLVIGGNCWPLSDRAFNDRLSLLRSKHSHHLQSYNFCDLNITLKKKLCRF